MIGTPVGKYRLILTQVDITRRSDCDPTTPEGPRPLDLLKLDLRILGFVWILGPGNEFNKYNNVGFAGSKSRILRNHGGANQENMCTDLLGPFLRPHGAPADSK